MAWLRLDENARKNKKLRNIPAELFRFWFNCLCFARSTDNQGRARDGWLDISDLAWDSHLSETKATVQVEKLVSAVLVDKIQGRYRMHDWDLWQYKSDLSTPRTRRFRERHKNGDGTDGRNGSPLSSVRLSSESERNTSEEEQTSDGGAAILKKSLASYFEGRLGEPDEKLVRQCMQAGAGAPVEEIQWLLKHLWQNGQSPRDPSGPRGWGWFPSVIREHFAGRRAN
jgi:hypothetical protein